MVRPNTPIIAQFLSFFVGISVGTDAIIPSNNAGGVNELITTLQLLEKDILIEYHNPSIHFQIGLAHQLLSIHLKETPEEIFHNNAAKSAYRKCLSIDLYHVDANTNLGMLLSEHMSQDNREQDAINLESVDLYKKVSVRKNSIGF